MTKTKKGKKVGYWSYDMGLDDLPDDNIGTEFSAQKYMGYEAMAKVIFWAYGMQGLFLTSTNMKEIEKLPYFSDDDFFRSLMNFLCLTPIDFN